MEGVLFIFKEMKSHDNMPVKEKPTLLLSRIVYRAIIFPHKYKPIVPPMHLYGELCRTPAGFDYIKDELKPLIRMFKDP